jgi:hypothetical protein
VQTEVTEPRSVAVTVAPCPYCDTHEAPEDRDGVISCPNCGYPLTQEIPLIDEWEMLIADASGSTPGVSPARCAGHDMDETGWAHLLTEIDALGLEDNGLC